MSNEFIAKGIQINNEQRQLQISWQDGHISQIPIDRVRGYCPCAVCQHHQNTTKYHPNRVSSILSAKLVGHYAVQFEFSDKHQTGIFRFEYLRKLDPVEEGRWGTI